MNNSNNSSAVPASPIPITGRGRRSSVASSIPALSNSPTSPIAASLATPSSTFSTRFGQAHSRSVSETSSTSPGAPGTSPSSPLAYFLGAATSPIRATAGSAFPFGVQKTPNGNGTAAHVIDEDEELASNVGLFGVGAHTRRGSWAQGGGFGTTMPASTSTTGNDRGTSVLRRLSLSGAFQRPSFNNATVPAAPPPSAISPTVPTLREPRPGRKTRAASLAVNDPSKKRGISPMGERLLKGHFDGFI